MGDELGIISVGTQNEAACEAACLDTQGCTFYVYLQDGRCVLKNNLLTGLKGSNSVDPAQFVNACVHTTATSATSEQFACLEGFDFMGTELEIASAASDAECESRCLANTACSFYIMTTDSLCVLKADLLCSGGGSNGPASGVAKACVRVATASDSDGASPSPQPSSPNPPSEGDVPPPGEDGEVTPPPSSVSTSYGCPDAQAALDSHNAARARYGAPPLVWSDTLAQFAHSVSSTCKMEHSGGPYGENLAWGTNMDTCAHGVQLWMDEESLWSPGMDFTHETGHFTQVVWAGSTQVGCALVCNMVTCNYDPPGNVQTQFGDNIGTPSS